MLKVGTAPLVVAEVLGVTFGPAADPLVYHDRTFLTVSDLKEAGQLQAD